MKGDERKTLPDFVGKELDLKLGTMAVENASGDRDQAVLRLLGAAIDLLGEVACRRYWPDANPPEVRQAQICMNSAMRWLRRYVSGGGELDRPRRFFSADQKREIYFRAKGRCSICGDLLRQDWHADHVQPWSGGGETTLDNAQALCAYCNVKKHDTDFTEECE